MDMRILTRSLIVFTLFLAGIVWINAAAQADVILSARYFGKISPGSGGPAPQAGDLVLLVYESDHNNSIAVGAVTDGDGSYSVRARVSASFGQPQVTLLLRRGSNTYALAPANSSTFKFRFFGGVSEVVAQYDLEIRDLLSVAGPFGGALQGNGGAYDVNKDGVFTRADIRMMSQAMGKGTRAPEFDFNKDGIANSRDVVAAIKAYREAEFKNRIQKFQ